VNALLEKYLLILIDERLCLELLKRSSERAPAQERRGVGTFVDDTGEGVRDLEIKVWTRRIARPGVNRDFRNLQFVLHQEAAEHRQTLEQGTDAALDDRLDPLAPDLLLPVLEGFHAVTVRAGCVRGISPQRWLVSIDTNPLA